MTDGTSFWVVDGTALKVFKYTLAGSLLGSWSIDPANAHPTGITINPSNVSDIWIVDSGTDKVYQYLGAASRTSGSQNAGATFALAAGNTNPQGIADPPPGSTHSGHPADTLVVPFKITGGGNAPSGLPVIPGLTGPHNATGTATLLGNYTGQGVFTLDSIDLSTLSGTFHGTFTFVAANGDKLVMSYGTVTPGTFTLTPPDANGNVVAQFVAVFTPVPEQSTGRFAHVIGGSFVMVATTAPFLLSVNAEGYTPAFTYTWQGQGTLEFAAPRGNRRVNQSSA